MQKKFSFHFRVQSKFGEAKVTFVYLPNRKRSMTTYTKFKEYIWLVNTIYHAKAITFAEINERWLETNFRLRPYREC